MATVTERVNETLKYEWLWLDNVYYNNKPDKPERYAEKVSGNIERQYFSMQNPVFSAQT